MSMRFDPRVVGLLALALAHDGVLFPSGAWRCTRCRGIRRSGSSRRRWKSRRWRAAWYRSIRGKGDNLYAASIVAVKAATGDSWGYDATQPLVHFAGEQ